MAMVRWDPFRDLEEMQNRLSYLFGRPGRVDGSKEESMTVAEWIGWIFGQRFGGALNLSLWNDPIRWDIIDPRFVPKSKTKGTEKGESEEKNGRQPLIDPDIAGMGAGSQPFETVLSNVIFYLLDGSHRFPGVSTAEETSRAVSFDFSRGRKIRARASTASTATRAVFVISSFVLLVSAS